MNEWIKLWGDIGIPYGSCYLDDIELDSICKRGLNAPGVLIKLADNSEYLIGHINDMRGVCDDCVEFPSEEIVIAYKIVWQPTQLLAVALTAGGCLNCWQLPYFCLTASAYQNLTGDNKMCEFEPLTCGGFEYRIYARDHGYNRDTIVGAIKNNMGVWVGISWDKDGSYGSFTDVTFNLIPIKDYRSFKIDDAVIVWNNDFDKLKRHFAGVSTCGKPMAFYNGKTSWTTNDAMEWDNCVKKE